MADTTKSPKTTSYHAHISEIIYRKKYRLIKRTLVLGRHRAEVSAQNFIDAWLNETSKLVLEKVNLAALVAQQMIAHAIENEPHVIISMIRSLLKNIAEHADVEITLHPDDARIVKSSWAQMNLGGESIRKFTLIEDAGFTRGSIIIKANKSIIDAHIKTQIDKSKDLILLAQEL